MKELDWRERKVIDANLSKALPRDASERIMYRPAGAALHENNEASAKVTTANGGTFTSSSARLSSQSRYSTLDR